MNKIFIIGIVVVLIVGATIFSRTFLIKGEICTAEQGEDVVINMITKENQWEFDPPVLKFNKCDRVTLNIYNEDEYDHGFAIDVFGVNKRLNPHATTTIQFTASKTGEAVFYCSVPCGEGHFGHKGKATVVDIVDIVE